MTNEYYKLKYSKKHYAVIIFYDFRSISKHGVTMNIFQYEMLFIIIVFLISYYITSVIMERKEDRLQEKLSSLFLYPRCKLSFFAHEAKE